MNAPFFRILFSPNVDVEKQCYLCAAEIAFRVDFFVFCLFVPQMFDIMKQHSAVLISSMKKKADKDEPLELKE